MGTLVIQIYWNYKNYLAGKQQLINEVQTSLDNAMDSYYVDLADRNTFGFSSDDKGSLTDAVVFDSLIKKMNHPLTNLDSLKKDYPVLKFYSKSQFKDSNLKEGEWSEIQVNPLKTLETSDQNKTQNKIFELASKVIVSITTDTLHIPELNVHIKEQLRQKNIASEFGYVFKNNSGKLQEYNAALEGATVLSTQSKSAYLPQDSNFRFFFTNDTTTILKRNLLGIFLSALLIAAVIGCLLFLLKIINRQKQLAELKNDLISNITHEFKTPISTVKVALEGIENFNKENDPVKTQNYLQISNNQLDKLQIMVEKLLETASLDGDNLKLKKEEVPLVRMLSDLIEKHQNLAGDKEFSMSAEENEILLMADPFHLENALNNILDNAVKYGGNNVQVVVSSEKEVVKIMVSDNGNSLTKPQAEQVFDKFYRVPKGNTHDVKGFGIGLFYTRNIIEKHGGSVELLLNQKTNFHITIPKNA